MKAQELRDLKIEQIETLIDDLSKEIFELRNELALSKKLDQPHLICQKRKTRARAKTILEQKRKQTSVGKRS